MITSAQFFHHSETFLTQSGESLPGFTLAYETYGTLNADKSNVILLFHALSGTAHAAGRCEAVPGVGDRWTDDVRDGWWNDFIGEEKPLDTGKYFVICANYLGGCYGSTGPSSINPATGQPWGSRFPHLSVTDVVRSQVLLLDSLGIGKLHAVIGPSIGGLMALTFATRHPDRVRLVVPIASGGATTVLNRLALFEQILAIENDPHFSGGDYYAGEPPTYGLALARMISHKTFVHLDTIEGRATGDVKQPDDQLSWYRLRDQVESYMLYQGKKFVSRFDANSYLRFCEMWSSFHPLRDAGVATWKELLTPCKEHAQQFLIFTIDSDFCFYPEEQAALAKHLREARVAVHYHTVHSDKGHDSFLLEPELYTPFLTYALEVARVAKGPARAQ
jgi:homoserine O-acetyltransferase